LVGDPATAVASAFRRQRTHHGRSLKTFPRQALHARFLELDHPTTGKRMSWESPLPEDFVWLLTLLKQDREAFIG
jgi:23S rRNA pseudouridine1911/1915/1917 synthase